MWFANFVTKEIDDSHPARPKPLYKTHKLNEDGTRVSPVPIINVLTKCGTPKVCQVAIKHLTAEKHLTRNNKSTNAALHRIIFVNDNLTPLHEDSI